MAKEEMYHIALDDYEHGIIIRFLNDEKTDLMNEGNRYGSACIERRDCMADIKTKDNAKGTIRTIDKCIHFGYRL